MTGVAESGGDTSSETVEMLPAVAFGNQTYYNKWYTDAGTTELDFENSQAAAISSAVFETDTLVKITVNSNGESIYDSWKVGCESNWDGINYINQNNTDTNMIKAHYAEGFGKESWAAVNYSVEYMVRAGYPLIVASYFNDSKYVDAYITVEKVVG